MELAKNSARGAAVATSPDRARQVNGPQPAAWADACPKREICLGEKAMHRHTLKFSILGAAFFALCLPVLATAQGRYPDYGRYPDNGRYPDYSRNGRYDERYLKDSIHRLDKLAKDFQKDLDRALDRSRRNGSRSEDQLNADAREFRNAAGDLKSRFGNGRDLNRSANEAQRVLAAADRIDRARRWFYNDGRTASEWSQIQQELRVISDAYGSSGYYRNDPYGRDDDYRRQRNRNVDDWIRKIPWPR